MMAWTDCCDVFGAFTSPAVVPIFVNTGAALIPAVLAAVASAAALLFKPRQLLRACRRKPHVPVLVLAGGVLIWFVGSWLPYALFGGGGNPPRTRRAGGAEGAGDGRIDWAEVALEIIRGGKGAEAVFAAKSGPAAADPVFSSRTGLTVFRTDYSRCGYDGGPVPLDLKPRWRHAEEDVMFLSSPAVVGDRVYAASCYLDAGANYGSVLCLDAASGRVLWCTEMLTEEEDLKGFFSSPAVTEDGKHLVIGQGLHFDRDSHLVCLDTSTGRIRWSVKTPLHIEGSPAVSGDLAVAGAGAIETVPGRRLVSDPGFVMAVRISDGKELWRHPVRDPESSPAITGGVVYIGSGFGGGAVVALRTETDEKLREKELDRVLWRTPTGHPITSAVTVFGKLLIAAGGNGDYVASDPNSPEGVVVALDRSDGKMLWRRRMEDAVLGAVAARGGMAVCSGRTGEVIALDVRDGRVLWRRRLKRAAPLLAAPAFTGEYVYAVSQDGYLAVLRAEDGEILEKHYLNDKERPGAMGLCVSSPAIAGGRLFVGSETGGVRCFVGRRLR